MGGLEPPSPPGYATGCLRTQLHGHGPCKLVTRFGQIYRVQYNERYDLFLLQQTATRCFYFFYSDPNLTQTQIVTHSQT